MRVRRFATHALQSVFWSLVLLISSFFTTANAQQPGLPDAPKPKNNIAQPKGASESGWPRTFTSGVNTFTIYQTQVDKWNENLVDLYCAVELKEGGKTDAKYGVVWIQTRTEVDKVNRLVTLDQAAITKVKFPVAPDKESELTALLEKRLSTIAANASSRATEAQIRDIIESGQLSVLRWPDFSDYKAHLKSFYESSGYSLAWIRKNQATIQAQATIDVLRQADNKGLNSDDYDASLWDARLLQLSDPTAAAQFDAALTVCVMRYISDLRIGRVNPRHFSFGINVERKKYDLAQFVRSRLANGDDIQAALAEVEPPFPGYKRTQAAFLRYLQLSQEDDGEKLPEITKNITPGKEYVGIPRLTRLLRLLDDLPSSANIRPGRIYQEPLVDAIKSFQGRHGLSSDGVLGTETVKQLNTSLRDRVEQLRLTLERWRWVPSGFPQPPIIVNIPEFRLRALDKDGRVVLSTNVVVGKAYRHETPVFEDEMQYVVFRPYWNVPPGIQRSEIVPAIQRDRDYVPKNNYEVTTPSGAVVTSGTINDEVLQQLRGGKLAVRQKPGPSNALGLVKLIFPNSHNVYLHSTPSQQLFSQSRRDFSHGCIRVEKAAELAAWALAANSEDWSLEKVLAAMQGTQDNVQVILAHPIPVLIVYGTAVVTEDGIVHFYDDIYGHDAALEKVLAKGYPYPG